MEYDSPRRLGDDRPYTTPRLVSALAQFQRENQFVSNRFCTARQAAELGRKIHSSQRANCVAYWFQKHYGYRAAEFYNEDQLED